MDHGDYLEAEVEEKVKEKSIRRDGTEQRERKGQNKGFCGGSGPSEGRGYSAHYVDHVCYRLVDLPGWILHLAHGQRSLQPVEAVEKTGGLTMGGSFRRPWLVVSRVFYPPCPEPFRLPLPRSRRSLTDDLLSLIKASHDRHGGILLYHMGHMVATLFEGRAR